METLNFLELILHQQFDLLLWNATFALPNAWRSQHQAASGGDSLASVESLSKIGRIVAFSKVSRTCVRIIIIIYSVR